MGANDHRPAAALDGTVARVTGASSGIGEATARDLAGQGAAVALVARRAERLDALAGRIREDGGTALVVQADVTEEPQAADAVERCVSELGRLDMLINNAGMMLLGPILDAPLDEWERMVRINVLGLLYCAHAALPHLLDAAEDDPRHVARPEILESIQQRFGDVERLHAEDIADAIGYIVTRPRHVAINELLVRPTEQTG